MTKGRAPDTVPMQLTLDPHGGPRHQQIYAALRAAILNGALRREKRARGRVATQSDRLSRPDGTVAAAELTPPQGSTRPRLIA